MTLKILLIEDSDDDAALVVNEFRKNSIQLEWRRVDTAAATEAALGENWDAIICDYSMPTFSAKAALKLVQQKGCDFPFLVVSGSIGEDRAVQMMKAGAHDYLLKDNLIRLVPAVTREIHECEERRQRRKAEQELASANFYLGRLKRFFPPKIAEFVLSGQTEDPFKWHRKNVTVVFIDLRGFTAFSEIAEPEEVMGVLQVYYSRLAAIAHRNDGSVGHLAGDGVMLFFNDPVSVENPEKKAVLMALQAKAELEGLCRQWQQQDFSLGFGIGIASGYATIGGIGDAGFWDYTVVGTVTNLASRLCSEAQPGQILVSRRFFGSVESWVEAEDIGSLTLKGLHRPVSVVNVFREKASASSAEGS
jgi:class 3 adenylate cyclase/CheY-like chemotaxis protein